MVLRWAPNPAADEPYVALQRASALSAAGSAPGHPVVVDLTQSELAFGARTY